MTEERSPKNFFESDRPIQKLVDDELNRADFSKSLARALTDWKGKDSLVVALFGPWGSGKSSIKNMVVELMTPSDAKGENVPLVIEFNPWEAALGGKLIERFFQDIGDAIGHKGKGKEYKKLADRWHRYGEYLTASDELLGGFRAMAGWIGGFILGAGAAGHVSAAVRVGLVIVGAMGILIGISKSVANGAARILKARIAGSAESLEERKKLLSDALRKSSRSVLVIVDDLDRLLPSEMRSVLQLVKTNADFPQMVYLLLCQRDILEKALSEVSYEAGNEFVEKIIQVPFEVPAIERPRLEKLLFRDLDLILNRPELENRSFDTNRWANIFLGGLRDYFESLRDVKRFLSTFSFQLNLFAKSGSLEVNPMDLIVVEVLRMFEPRLYSRLPEYKDLLTGHPFPGEDSREKERRKKELEALLEPVDEKHRQKLLEILTHLFPQLKATVANTYSPDGEVEWVRDLRICTGEFFDRYFVFGIPEGDVPQSAIDGVLHAAGDRDALGTRFAKLAEAGLLEEALSRLDAYKQSIPIESAVPFITALFDLSRHIPENRRGPFRMDPDTHVMRIIFWFLKQESDPKRRVRILTDAIGQSYGLYLPVDFVAHESNGSGRKQDPDAFVVEVSDLNDLQAAVVQKIENAANSGELAKTPRLLEVLYRWKEWGDLGKVREWVDAITKDQAGALLFVKAAVRKIRSHLSGERMVRFEWEARREDMEEFIDPEELRRRLGDINVATLSIEERSAVDAFLRMGPPRSSRT